MIIRAGLKRGSAGIADGGEASTRPESVNDIDEAQHFLIQPQDDPLRWMGEGPAGRAITASASESPMMEANIPWAPSRSVLAFLGGSGEAGGTRRTWRVPEHGDQRNTLPGRYRASPEHAGRESDAHESRSA